MCDRDADIVSLSKQRLLRAGWRYEAVHAQVFDHLAIVVVAVGGGEGCDGGAGAEAVDGLDGDEGVLGGDGRDRLVCICERRFQGSHCFVLVRDGADGLDVAVGLDTAPPEKEIVGLGEVCHLAHEAAHSVELRLL